MPARISEAIVLRTYPLKEADLIVSFLTRDGGKLRGVANRARRPKSGFGAALERLTHGKIFYFQRETRELVKLEACEMIHSHFGLHGDLTISVALDFIAEVSEQFLPPAEVKDPLQIERARLVAARNELAVALERADKALKT